MTLLKELNESQKGIPGKPGWKPAVERGKKLVQELSKLKKDDGSIADTLYNMMQNVPKRHFLEMLNVLNVKPDAAFEKELQKAEDKP